MSVYNVGHVLYGIGQLDTVRPVATVSLACINVLYGLITWCSGL